MTTERLPTIQRGFVLLCANAYTREPHHKVGVEFVGVETSRLYVQRLRHTNRQKKVISSIEERRRITRR